MLAALYVLAAISFGASVWMTFEAPQQAFFLPMYRAWELLVGAIIALGGIPKPSATVARIAPLAGLGAILLEELHSLPQRPFPGWRLCCPAWALA